MYNNVKTALTHKLAGAVGPHCSSCWRSLSTTATNGINQKWRQERGLPMNPNACGPLTDKADFTFVDGRPTPYGTNQVLRMVRQKEIAKSIIELTREVDFAVERHKMLLEQKDRAQEEMLRNKLQPKGMLLLKK